MAPFVSARSVLLSSLTVCPTTAFITPTGSVSFVQNRVATAASTVVAPVSLSSRLYSPSSAFSRRISMVSEVAEEKAARLRETAAKFRDEAAALEAKRQDERRAGADRSFSAFDSNNDGAVGVAELQAGLEGPLRKSFVEQLTARMGRKPNREEVNARVAQLPGGKLFPDELAHKLIAVYDENGDGVLQKSEFAPREELRTRLETMFREQRDRERRERMEERQRQMEEKKNSSEDVIAASGEGRNDGPATIIDRFYCALPYLLPLADSLAFAGHLFGTFPEETAWAQPLAAVLLALRSVPFATLVTFFGLSIASSNPRINKLVRFNMQQAVNLDIALILPGVLGALAAASLGQDGYKLMPLQLAGSDVVFVSMLIAVAYSVSASSLGIFPNKLPLLGRFNRENPDKEDA